MAPTTRRHRFAGRRRWSASSAQRPHGDVHGRGPRPTAGQQLPHRHRGALLSDLTLPDADTDVRDRPGGAETGMVGLVARSRGVSPMSSRCPRCRPRWERHRPQVFSELRTTKLGAQEAIDAYTDAIQRRPGSTSSTRHVAIPIDDVAQGVYASRLRATVLAVIAFGPRRSTTRRCRAPRSRCRPTPRWCGCSRCRPDEVQT